ncbi:MAG TPA: zinc-dependent metalloprotease, partial [Flavobacteriaceae bacterium]|nr:zinc-dependent metalloprotease [Flavobacteriaceae bacterium]
SILKNAQIDSLRFIADRDARAKSGAHVYAHLWDNGTNASKELENVLKIRETAISNFSEDNIREGETYSTLEDVFVPLYFFHRYQTEAVSKIIGGLDYNYAVKGDDELIVETVEPEVQREALKSLLKTISAKTLAIPESKLKLFPPRVYGSSRTRESFKSKTGVAFDALSAVETASDMALSTLFNAERMNRVYEQSIFDKSQLTVNEIFGTVFSESLKKKPEKGYLGEVQQMINFSVLKNIMAMSSTNNLLPQVQAIINFELMKLKVVLQIRHIDPIAMLMVKQIDSYLGNPSGFKAVASPKIPDGSPIGNDVCNYILD